MLILTVGDSSSARQLEIDWGTRALQDILDLPELITVTQDQVHVFVKGLEGANEDATILQNAPHPEVDVLQHLTALPHRLKKDHTDLVIFNTTYSLAIKLLNKLPSSQVLKHANMMLGYVL